DPVPPGPGRRVSGRHRPDHGQLTDITNSSSVLPLALLAVAVPLSRFRPGAAVFLVNCLCAAGMADSATPANAHVLSLAALSCLLGVRTAGAGARWRCSPRPSLPTSRRAPYSGCRPYGGSTP
ncbi:hypothetical protein ACFY15_36010, partial [Streptomyces sp. NPDC001373]